MKISPRNNQTFLQRFSARLNGFNQHALTLDDFWFECERRGVVADEIPMKRLHGCYFLDQGEPSIVINSLLSEPEKVIAGYHELAHMLDHPDSPCVFCSTGRLWNLGKTERQAQIVGVMALMPDRLIVGHNSVDLRERFQVSRAIAEYRLSLLI